MFSAEDILNEFVEAAQIITNHSSDAEYAMYRQREQSRRRAARWREDPFNCRHKRLYQRQYAQRPDVKARRKRYVKVYQTEYRKRPEVQSLRKEYARKYKARADIREKENARKRERLRTDEVYREKNRARCAAYNVKKKLAASIRETRVRAYGERKKS